MISRAKALMKTLDQDLDNDKILTIRGIKIPNFYLLSPFQWEFCHQLIDLYGEYASEGHFMYENDQIKITSSDIVFDCGANMGLFSLYAASKNAQVFAFEPNPKMKPYLEMVRFFYPSIQIIEKAVFSQSDLQMSYYQYDNPGSNHIIGERSQLKNCFSISQVETISLDDFGIRPTIIKMDIEGSEFEALQGSRKIIAHQPKLVIAAYHLKNDMEVLPQAILDLNAKYSISINKEIIFAY